MSKEITLEIMPTGHLKFSRGDEAHNKAMRQIIFSMVDGDEEIMVEVDEFFKGSEGVELLVGDTIFCG